MSVNRPTNIKIKEQDVNQKLQLYGIYSAFASGKVPSNEQVDIAMNSFLESRALRAPSKKLSEEGRNLVNDARDAVEKAKLLFLTKNEGNLLQDFIYQCTNIDGGDASTPNAPVDKETAKQHGNEALDGLRTLGTLLISNGQFRKLLNDSLILLRDIAGDSAQKVASKVNPPEEKLAQIDHPAEDNTWHETPDLSTSNIKQQMKDTYNSNKPFNREDIRSAADDAQAAGQSQPTNSDAAANGAAVGGNNLRATASENIDDDTKDKANELKDRTANYVKEKIPKERREQTIWRLKKMIVEIQGHQDYQRAIDTLLRLAETYTGHTQDVASQTTDTVKGAHSDTNLKTAEADLKVLIERFANSTSTDDLFDSINAIYRDADRDPELKKWFRQADAYLRKCLKQQGFVLQDQANDEWNELYDHGNFLLRERYRNHTDRIVDEVKFLADQFDADPQNRAFAASMNKLFTNLGNDENGKPTFKTHLVKDLTDVIVPAIFENIRYVPIPRIEYSDPMADAIIENLVIEGDNLAPNSLEFKSDNYWLWGRKQISNHNKNKVMVSVSGIQCDLRDVSYYIKKKQGFPSLTDKGVMDIFLGGSGFSFKIALETADKRDKNHFFKVDSVVVDVRNMKIKIKQSRHKLLFSIVKPLLLRVMRPILQKVISKQIKDNINKLDAFCHEIQLRANEAEAQAKRNPEEAANIYQRYYNAFQQRLAEGKQKTQETVEDKKVNMAVTQHDSIFKNIVLPGGISSKATEYKELAMKGEKWESPVFSIGSAKPTSSLPKVTPVKRKPHQTAPSQLRDAGASSGYTPNGGAFGTSATRTTGVGSGTYATTQTNGSAAPGFANHVDKAFDSTASTTAQNTNTTLGTANPVLQGNV